MKNTNLSRLLTIVLILSVFTAVTIAQTPEQEKRLQEIDEYIAQRRISTQEYFATQYEEVREKARIKLELFKEQEMSRLFDTALNYYDYMLVPVGYFEIPYYKLVAYKDAEQAQINIDLKKQQVEERLAFDIAELETMEAYALSTALVDLENKLKKNVLDPPAKPRAGLITGIIYDTDRPAAVIGEKIVYVGDTISDIRIITISPDSVEFERNGRKWTQQVNQKPAGVW